MEIMKSKALAIGKSLLWGFVVLLFPITSGALSVILSLDAVETLLLQGAFMLLALVPPAGLVLRRKWHWREIGFAPFDADGSKRALYFIPLLAMLVPVAMDGFYIKSMGYLLGNLFLYLFVGISEEVYFRGIVPKYLKAEFSNGGVVLVSTLVFGIGHIATALTGTNGLEIALTILNALIFGWLAMEMTFLSANISPVILMHFLFDFETKIVVMQGRELLIAECVRGIIMFLMASWFAVLAHRQQKLDSER